MNRNSYIKFERKFSKHLIALLVLCGMITLNPSAFSQNKPDAFKGLDDLIKKAKEEKKADKPIVKDAEKEKPARVIPAQVAEQIKKLALIETKKRMDFMEVVIEDVTRLCKLDKGQQSRLLLAAKGSCERSMKKWHDQAARHFESRIKGQDSKAVKDILANMGNVNFGGRDTDKQSESQDLWKDTLKDVLSEDQVKLYEEVVTRRKEARVDAYTQISIMALDNFLRLTPEQKDKMQKIVRGSASEFLDEVQRYWGNYFENGMLMSLANVAEEDVLKGILSKKQFDRLRSATTNFDHFWDQKRKLRKAKIKAAEHRKQKAEAAAAESKASSDKK